MAGWKVGKNYFIRTVTMSLTGELAEFDDKELVLRDAAWIAVTGRFAEFLMRGKGEEVEPFPDGDVIVGRGGVIDACEWKHPLPRTTK